MAAASRLRDESWAPVRYAELVKGFLVAEGGKLRNEFVKAGRYDLAARLTEVLARDQGLEDEPANAERWDVLMAYRAPLLSRVPTDTRWFRVKFLRDSHLGELRVIGRCGWEDRGQNDANEVRDVARRKLQKGEKWVMSGAPDGWGFLLLWGHSRRGPFTILDGNNRLVEYAATPNAVPFQVAAYVGTSTRPCVWHLGDPAFQLDRTYHFNAAIISYIRDQFKVLVGDRTAEDAKVKLASITDREDARELVVRGRDVVTGLPREVVITDVDIREAISQSVDTLVETVKGVLEKTPPEVLSDIMQRGIHLSGGGALIPGLSSLLEEIIQVPVIVVPDPLRAVVRGTGIVLENLQNYEEILIGESGELPTNFSE